MASLVCNRPCHFRLDLLGPVNVLEYEGRNLKNEEFDGD